MPVTEPMPDLLKANYASAKAFALWVMFLTVGKTRFEKGNA